MFAISCENNFDPYGDYQDKYSLTCILSGNTNFQTAVILNSYPPENENGNISERFITNADVRLWQGDSVYIMKDSIIYSETYPDGYKFYFVENLQVQFNKAIQIEALLENGKRLKSESKTTTDFKFEDNSAVLIPPVSSDVVTFYWKGVENGDYFQPRLRVKYSQIVNGINKISYAELPVRYQTSNGVERPVFPSATNQQSIAYQLSAITKFLNELSGSTNKSLIAIYQKLDFDVAACDQSLSTYLSSTNSSLDNLSVSLDENDYTNITGGFGIFGSFVSKDYTKIRFLESYIREIGYDFINEN